MYVYDKENPNSWMFRFALHDEYPKKVPRAKPDELMDVIVAWAEKNDLLVIGGYRSPTEIEDIPAGPDFPKELLFPMRPEDD